MISLRGDWFWFAAPTMVAFHKGNLWLLMVGPLMIIQFLTFWVRQPAFELLLCRDP